MKNNLILLLLYLLIALLVFLGLILGEIKITIAQESYQINGNLSFQILENGNWRVKADGIDYLFHWLTPDLMRAEGSDNSCWYVYQNEGEMATPDCSLVELSKLMYRMR